MKKIVDILSSLLCGAFVWMIANAGCEYYSDYLKSSGGVVLSSELIYLNILPFILSGIGAYVSYKLINNK